MSNAVRSDGADNEAFGEVASRFSSYSQEELDMLVSVMAKKPKDGQPKLDKCTLINLMAFALAYRQRFTRHRSLPVEYYLNIKLKQSHVEEDFNREFRRGGDENEDPINRLLK
jgi:hypothetical protein